MDILSDYRITALIVSEREFAQRAERARVALERAPHRRARRERLSRREPVTAPCTTVNV